MKKIDKKITNISILIIIIPIIFSIINFFLSYTCNPSSYFYHNEEELNLISHYSFWWYLINSSLFSYIVYFLPLIITFYGCYKFFKIYHSGTIFNILQRKNYKQFWKETIISIWKKGLILPIIFGVLFIVTIFIIPNSTIHGNNLDRFLFTFQSEHEYMSIINPTLFVFLYTILILLFSVFIINLGIILARFIKKFSLLVIGNFMTAMILENIFNFVLAPIAKYLTNYDRMMNGFSIMNICYLDGIPSLLWEFFWIILLISISYLIIYKLYKNPERVLNNYD